MLTFLIHFICPDPALSTHRSTTINLEINTGDELALVRGEERTNIGDIRRVRKSAQRHVEQELFHILLGVRNTDKHLEQAGSREERT